MNWLWVAIGLVVFLLAARLFSSKQSPRYDLSPKTAEVSDDEAHSLSADIRHLAYTGYDRASAKALQESESERFAHECGILDAGYCVLANKSELRADARIRQDLQMELVPFNILGRELGRSAVAEYLVWKFFPGQADNQILERAFDRFVEAFLRGGDSDPPSDREMQQFIYSGRYGWQPLAQEAISRRA